MTIVFTPVDGLETLKIDGGNRVQDPSVYLIFWGSYWGGVNSSRAIAIENAAANLLNSSFFNVAAQYGVGTNLTLAGFAYDSSNPTSGSFGGASINSEIQSQIGLGKFPNASPTQSMYVVVTPPGMLSDNPNDGGFNEAGISQTTNGVIPECWVSTQALQNGSPDTDRFSLFLSHEVAECMTDPGGNGYEVNHGPNWTLFQADDQIADAEGNLYSFHLSNGAEVQPLWSRRDQAWVVNDGTTQKFYLTPIWDSGSFTGLYDLVINEDQNAATGNSLVLGTNSTTGGLEVTLNGETVDFDPFVISNVTVNTNGNPYTVHSLPPGITLTVNQNGGPFRLGFIPLPAQVVVGGVLSPAVKVEVLDRNGALVTGDNSYITLSIATRPPDGGILRGTLTVQAIDGIATFVGVSLSNVGDYTVEATGINVAACFSTTITVTPPPFHLVFNVAPVSILAGATMPTVTVAIEDSADQTMTTENSNVTLTILSGPAGGTIVGSTTVATVNGVASFSDLSFTIKGSYVLQATDGSHVLANSSSFLVASNVASQLIFAQGPTNVIAGDFIAPGIQVVVEDAYGNYVSTSGLVSLGIASRPSGGAFIHTSTKVPLSNGVASFNSVALTKIGDYTLIASFGGISRISGSFTVSPSASSQIAFIGEPTDLVAGNVLSPGIVLQVEDLFGNAISSDSNSNVTLALQSLTSGDTLPGTLTETVHNGIATFSNISLQKAGTYIFEATSGVGPTTLSSQFVVSAAAPAQLLFTEVPNAVTVAGALTPVPVVEILDEFGNIVSGANSAITLAGIGGPSGVALGGTTSVNAVNGVATFGNVSLTTVGTYRLLATDGSLSNATSASFSINPAAVSQLQFISLPHNTYVGANPMDAISVQLEDRFGNVIGHDGSSVTLGIQNGPAGGTILGNTTAIVQNGLATFNNIKFSKAGSFTLKAADGSVVAAANSAISVVLPPAKVAFAVQPSATAAGHALTALSVDVEDSTGHIVVTDSSNVTISLVSTANGAIIHGTLMAQAVNGVATFSNLSITQAETYSLTATDANLTPAKSKTFVIAPDASSERLVVLDPPPATATTGTPLLPVLKVALEDQFGNLFTADHSKVTVAVSNGTSGILAGTTTVSLANGVVSFSKLSFTGAGNFTLNLTDSNLTAVGTQLNLVIHPAATTATLKVSASTLASAKPLKLTAVVAGSGTTGIIPTGTITFKDGSTIVGMVSLGSTSKRTAVLTISSLTVGTHRYTAVFVPDADLNAFAASTSLSQNVTIS